MPYTHLERPGHISNNFLQGRRLPSFLIRPLPMMESVAIENHPATMAEVPIRLGTGGGGKCVQSPDILMFSLHYKESPWKEQYTLQWALHRENRRRKIQGCAS